MLTRMLVLDFRAKDVWKSGEMTSGHIPVVFCVEFSKYLLIKILKFMRKKRRGN